MPDKPEQVNRPTIVKPEPPKDRQIREDQVPKEIKIIRASK
jgi:hypothetical protein